jgi:hypothetical protein
VLGSQEQVATPEPSKDPVVHKVLPAPSLKATVPVAPAATVAVKVSLAPSKRLDDDFVYVGVTLNRGRTGKLLDNEIEPVLLNVGPPETLFQEAIASVKFGFIKNCALVGTASAAG